MIRSNPDNVWLLTTRTGEEHIVKCPSKTGAKLYLASQIGKEETPFRAELCPADRPREGEKVLQAEFRQANDPLNWEAGNI